MNPTSETAVRGASGQRGRIDDRAGDRSERRRRTRELFLAYATSGERRHRNDIVELHLDVADFFVRRYRHRGVPAEDLRQIALVAMIRCVDRYDLDQEVEFSTFASRTIEGELKRWFRDRTWAVRPPRGAQELHLRMRAAEDELTHALGRVPNVHELARHLDESVDAVLTAQEVSHSYYATSLDAPVGGADADDLVLADVALGADDAEFDQVDIRDALGRLVADLDDRDRTILRLRFYENQSQETIAAQLGISQSYLSRVLRRILDRLRADLQAGEVPIGPPAVPAA